ncbi:SIS domain-containing protein [Treponema sp. HNW]|uniref:SIS domain-containing protein n=1 Tax=Treponema sp. HNW TaxID=3116654 RepID=UPI003D0FB005
MSKFYEEILQVPEALHRAVAYYKTTGLESLNAWLSLVHKHSALNFLGMGTSEFSVYSALPKIDAGEVPVFVRDAGEYLYYGPEQPNRTVLTILTSQSGESVEIRKLLENKRVTSSLIGITNNRESILGRCANVVFPLFGGEEASISAKTYTNTLAVLNLMGETLAKRKVPSVDFFDVLDKTADSLLSVPNEEIQKVVNHLLPGDAIAFVGRGPAYTSARQSALTFMEGTRCLSSPFTGGAFRHGPFESVGKLFSIVIYCAKGKTSRFSWKLALDSAKLGAKVLVITDEPAPVKHELIRVLTIPNPAADDETLFPLAVSGIHPRIVHALAKERGFEAGIFNYGEKITVTE